ncbi:MAG: choice-of-anchor Q domain-containing protein [Candidatus Spyradenecus sp.]
MRWMCAHVKAAAWFLVWLLFPALAVAEALEGATLWAKVRERFPELGLTESVVPTVRVATDRTTLQAALNAAVAEAGEDLILLDGSTSATWEGSASVTVTMANGGITVVSQNPETGDFATPVTFKGFGFAATPSSSAPLRLANFAIIEAKTAPTDVSIRCCAFNFSGTGTIVGSALSVLDCGVTSGMIYAGGVYAVSATVSLYNTTIANTRTALYGAVTTTSATVTLTHCTLSGNTNASGATVTAVTRSGSNATAVNCWMPTAAAEVTQGAGLPHCVPKASDSAIDGATAASVLAFDALGQPRKSGAAADLGAVEVQESTTVEPPADLVALASGPRQVYLGWSAIPRAQGYTLERAASEVGPWEDISEQTLWRSPGSGRADTIAGWASARFVAAEPGSAAYYRLAIRVTDQEPVRCDPVFVETPPATAVPAYHSRPGATRCVYLDFTGYVEDAAALVAAAHAGLSDPAMTYIATAPFAYAGRFGDRSKVYPTASAIYDIWRMVAEDFAAFDVDVTTEAPEYAALVKQSAEDEAYGKRVVIGYAQGTSSPWYPNSGAFAGGGCFGESVDRPVFIFSTSSRQKIAAQVTHEVSHTLGLSHDSGNVWFGDFLGQQTYYQGVELTRNGELNTSTTWESNLYWYPVMGAAPLAQSASTAAGERYFYDEGDFINQWSRGSYSLATNQEDDFAILLGLAEGSGTQFVGEVDYPAAVRNLTLAADEAGDAPAQAADLGALAVGGTLAAQGVIGKHITEAGAVVDDVDCYAIEVAQGAWLEASAVPGFKDLTEGASLDACLEVLTPEGELLVRADLPLGMEEAQTFSRVREAGLRVLLPAAGRYVLRVSGTVHPVSSTALSPDGSASAETPWFFNDREAYGSIGPYTLSATLSAASAGDLPVFPKPLAGDATDYTLAAQRALYLAAGGRAPATIRATDGHTGTLSAQAISEALACLSGALVPEGDGLALDYRFEVTDLTFAEGSLTVTVALSSPLEGCDIAFAEGISLALTDWCTGAEACVEAAAVEVVDARTRRFTLTPPAGLTCFRVRVLR